VRRPDQSGETAEKNWIVAATELDPANPEETKLLVVKSGQKPEWVKTSSVTGN
jgi:hypothetical protein